ncbi:MAG: isochorismatase family protein [Gammaproteobacteria bacterium]
MSVNLSPGDALILVDVQRDFLPGGSLAVPHGDAVVPILNRYIGAFAARALPVFATRDQHPPDHCSFHLQGGPWPVHCVAGTAGAAFAADLALPGDAGQIAKAAAPDRDAYSGFEGTDLEPRLRARGVRHLFVGGLATEYCVLRTVLDALHLGFRVFLLVDAIRAVEAVPGDGAAAVARMTAAGATAIRFADLRP